MRLLRLHEGQWSHMALRAPLRRLKSAARYVLRPQLAEGQRLLGTVTIVDAIARPNDDADDAAHLHSLC